MILLEGSSRPVGESFCSPSTTRGPVTVDFRFAATCSDALRCAGMRSSGGLWAIFYGDNMGSNPVGDANQINKLDTLTFFPEPLREQRRRFNPSCACVVCPCRALLRFESQPACFRCLGAQPHTKLRLLIPSFFEDTSHHQKGGYAHCDAAESFPL
jgi:hypothetical protein